MCNIKRISANNKLTLELTDASETGPCRCSIGGSFSFSIQTASFARELYSIAKRSQLFMSLFVLIPCAIYGSRLSPQLPIQAVQVSFALHCKNIRAS